MRYKPKYRQPTDLERDETGKFVNKDKKYGRRDLHRLKIQSKSPQKRGNYEEVERI